MAGQQGGVLGRWRGPSGDGKKGILHSQVQPRPGNGVTARALLLIRMGCLGPNPRDNGK